MSYTPPSGSAADFSWVGASSYSAPAGSAADLAFPNDVPQGRISVAGPLGEPAMLGAGMARGLVSAPSPLGAPALKSVLVHGRVTAPSPLGAALVLGRMPVIGYAAAPSPLGAPALLALHDFTGQLSGAAGRYTMELVTPTGNVRVPISSWQATLRAGSSNYVQCVVPACAAWVEALQVATEFVIMRRAELPGLVFEYEMARAPLEQLSLAQGPTNYSATLAGYQEQQPDSGAGISRTLEGVRSWTVSSGKLRARCAIDWLLRPGQTALTSTDSFAVSYINFYVPGNGDAYMDVGES